MSESERNWRSAIAGAVALAFVLTLMTAAVAAIWSGGSLLVDAALGLLVGLGTAIFMLWLFAKHQIKASDIWRGIGQLWHEFGKG